MKKTRSHYDEKLDAMIGKTVEVKLKNKDKALIGEFAYVDFGYGYRVILRDDIYSVSFCKSLIKSIKVI